MNCPDTKEAIEEKRKFVAKQTNQARSTAHVTIRGGGTIPLWAAYRCLYCGEYFNQTGAEQHFGMTREEYYGRKKFKRPTRCENWLNTNPRTRCHNRKDLKRVDLVSGWGLPKLQRTYYREYLCPHCRKDIKTART